jgi:hypothetical protein
VIQTDHMRARLKGLSARIVMSSWLLAPVAYSLIRPKSHIPSIAHDGTLSFRNFMLTVKFPKNFNCETLQSIGSMAMIRPKYQNFNIGHDSILSIGNSILMVKIIFYFIYLTAAALPVTDQQPKNALPISVATRDFLFIDNIMMKN